MRQAYFFIAEAVARACLLCENRLGYVLLCTEPFLQAHYASLILIAYFILIVYFKARPGGTALRRMK